MVQPLQTLAVTVRPATAEDRIPLEALWTASIGETRVAGGGRLHDLSTLPAVVATTENGQLTGALTYELANDAIEVISIDALPRHSGVGTMLLEHAAKIGIAAGARLLWLMTTNDNLDALRFYQRRGLHIMDVRVGGVSASRALKPTLPLIGSYGIPMRDEIVLGRPLAPPIEL